jgi:hypothetical protein
MLHHGRILAPVLLACFAIVGAARAPQPRLALSGRVVLEQPAHREAEAPRFTVRLYFPKAMHRPTLVTYTDRSGGFRFGDLDAGRYLLEVYADDNMVFQQALTVDDDLPQPFVIKLKS